MGSREGRGGTYKDLQTSVVTVAGGGGVVSQTVSGDATILNVYTLQRGKNIYNATLKIFFVFIFSLHWVFVAVRGLSLVAASRGYCSLRCAGFSLWWLPLLQSMGSRRAGFSSCSTQAQ